MSDFILEEYSSFWNPGDNFVLVKDDGKNSFCILGLRPRLTFSIIEDNELADAIVKKMIASGNIVFENHSEFVVWYQKNVGEL